MRVFFDSSAFVKRFVEERGSEEVDAYCQQASGLGLSIVCFPEIISALCRKVREGDISREHYISLKTNIARDVRDASIVNLVPQVVEKSIKLLESNRLRSLDTLHIACALEWRAEIFVSSDRKQIQAAENAGLRIGYIG